MVSDIKWCDMRKRLILFLIIIIIVSVVTTAIISAVFSTREYIDTKADVLSRNAKMISTVIVDDFSEGINKPMSYYAKRFSEDSGYRVTIINEAGEVLADSEKGEAFDELDNHGDREEVKQALRSGRGESNRESMTFGTTFLYSAVSSDYDAESSETDNENSGDLNKIIVRTAMELDIWEIARTQIIGSTLIASAVGIILAVIVALLYSKRLLRPVKEMEKQLETTMEQNMKAENVRREFVANVTHELKTPLTSISGFIETLQDEDNIDPETRARFLNIISVEAGRLSRLIDDILIISDIESGREVVSDRDINIRSSVNQVMDTLQPLAQEKNIDIIFNCEYEMYLGGSEDRFKQLILNLTENAIKYSENGGTVIIDAQKKESVKHSQEGEIIISVTDQGIGIADEDMARLFERFYRVDKSRSKKEGGTGLGLAIVKHIASLFDAEIEVQSVIGQGSTFTVRFPVK